MLSVADLVDEPTTSQCVHMRTALPAEDLVFYSDGSNVTDPVWQERRAEKTGPLVQQEYMSSC